MKGQPKSQIDLFVIEKVKSLRNEFGYSQAVLAVKLGVSDAFIGQIENPKVKSKYSIEQLNALAQIFECSPREFLPDKPIISK